MREIMLAITDYYQVTVEDIKGESRKGDLPEARKMACYLLSNKVKAIHIAIYLKLSRYYVYTATKDISFYINTYPNFKQRAMEIQRKSLELKKKELEAFLQTSIHLEPSIVYEKQKELEQINNQINN